MAGKRINVYTDPDLLADYRREIGDTPSNALKRIMKQELSEKNESFFLTCDKCKRRTHFKLLKKQHGLCGSDGCDNNLFKTDPR